MFSTAKRRAREALIIVGSYFGQRLHSRWWHVSNYNSICSYCECEEKRFHSQTVIIKLASATLLLPCRPKTAAITTCNSIHAVVYYRFRISKDLPLPESICYAHAPRVSLHPIPRYPRISYLHSARLRGWEASKCQFAIDH